MIRRLTAAALTMLSVLAVFLVLALAHRPSVAPAVLVRTASGQLVPAAPSAGVHATTQTSPGAGATQLVGATQSPTLAAGAATATTRTS